VLTLGVLGTVFLQCSSSTPDARPGDKTFETGGASGGAFMPPAGTGGATAGSITFDPAKPEPLVDGGRPPRCDDEGHCSCINIASLGKPARYGVNGMGSDNADAFQNWLNTNSSASVKLITNRVTLTPAFLADFDVIVLQALEDAEKGPFWQFTPEEVAAFTEWVNNGGGVITMTGYGGDADEVIGVNQLLQFTGMSYNRDDVLGTCTNPPPANCFCWGNSVAMTGWQPGSELARNITQVGAFHGRSINAPNDAEVVATDGTNKYAVAKRVGKGKVFVFSDEWVTYTSQWLSTSLMKVTDPYNQCYKKSADIVFQVPQFWYNVIRWANPTQCVFIIEGAGVIPQ